MFYNQSEMMVNLYFDEKAEKFNQFDRAFEKIAYDSFKARSVKIPSLIETQILDKLGYFETHQNQLTQIGSLKENEESNKRFLTPAGCLPLYSRMNEYTSNFPLAFTSLCQVYRYENGKWDHSHLWEFHCREIIFIGNQKYIEESFSKLEKMVLEYAEEQGLPLNKQIADDMFFKTEHGDERKAAILRNLQKNMELKYELSYKNKHGQSIALSSFNFHNTHFSKLYGWDNNGSIVSGCVGFGIERWIDAYYD